MNTNIQNITPELIESSKTMAEAARKCNLPFMTFKRYATKIGLYKPNQPGRGVTRKCKKQIQTEDLLSGRYNKYYQTTKMRKRLIDEGYKEDRCEKCGWAEKRPDSKYSCCELHHKDGDNTNNRLDNLEILCPNCHALSDWYCTKKKNRKRPD